jgi:hypothetical protein
MNSYGKSYFSGVCLHMEVSISNSQILETYSLFKRGGGRQETMIERRNYFLPSVRYKDCLSPCFCSLLLVFYFLYNFVIMGSACFPLFNFALITFRGFLSKIFRLLEKKYLATNVSYLRFPILLYGILMFHAGTDRESGWGRMYRVVRQSSDDRCSVRCVEHSGLRLAFKLSAAV